MGDIQVTENFLFGDISLTESGEKGAPSRGKNDGNLLLLSSTHYHIYCLLSGVTQCETAEIVVRSRKFTSVTMCMRFEKIHRPFVDTTYGFRVTDQSKWQMARIRTIRSIFFS